MLANGFYHQIDVTLNIGAAVVVVVTHSSSTCEVGGSNPEPYVGKLVVACPWSAVYSTEP